MIYVVAAATLIAWFLLIIIFIIPGASGVAQYGSSSGWFRGRGILGAVTDRASIAPIGSRPWLQKTAAFLVTIALTIVTADTFKRAEQQYEMGFMNANALRNDVTGALEVRVLRVISDLFLWLAQVQTLIRLFPRHKEKLIIKWFGFLLICLDIVFSCLNSFVINTNKRPRSYQDAIPALSYLFQLSLNLLYAAWVFYYAVTKSRYAFYHTMMPSIFIIALISIVSLLIPVAFFLVDILQPQIGAWGDYFRWVGAAAASIVVWEWVERIEALEREEKKDGILGREIFDGEDDYGFAPSDIASWGRRFRGNSGSETRRSEGTSVFNFGQIIRSSRRLFQWPQARSNQVQNIPESEKTLSAEDKGDGDNDRHRNAIITGDPPVQPPAAAASPVDRTHAHSAGSTVYAVHYHPVTNTPPLQSSAFPESNELSNGRVPAEANDHIASDTRSAESHFESNDIEQKNVPRDKGVRSHWNFATNVLRRGPKSPPAEIRNAEALSKSEASESGYQRVRHSLMGRLGAMTPNQAGKRPQHQEPVVIPAPPRGQTWSPDHFRHSPLESNSSVRQRSTNDQMQQRQLPARSGRVSPIAEVTHTEESLTTDPIQRPSSTCSNGLGSSTAPLPRSDTPIGCPEVTRAFSSSSAGEG